METEFEVKFYPINKEEYRRKLTLLGAKCINPERKMRRAIADRRAYPQLRCDLLRVRDESNKVTMTVKVHPQEGGKIADQKEVEVVVSDFEKAVEIMETVGLKPNIYQENLRETWNYNEAEVTIDTWPCLEPFTEIEAKSEERVREVAERLGFDWNKKIIAPVPEVMAKVYKLSIEEVLQKVTYLTFENNPFAGLKRND